MSDISFMTFVNKRCLQSHWLKSSKAAYQQPRFSDADDFNLTTTVIIFSSSCAAAEIITFAHGRYSCCLNLCCNYYKIKATWLDKRGHYTHSFGHLILILKTYSVVLHHSHLQRVFSLIRFIKKKKKDSALRFSPENSWAPWRWAMGGAEESWALKGRLAANTDIWCIFTAAPRSWRVIFIAGTLRLLVSNDVQIQCQNVPVIKHSSPKWREQQTRLWTPLLPPEKQITSTVHINTE